MIAHAFAPGHVSGLFAVHDEADDVLARGSRGAGWCVDRGAMASVTRAPKTTILLNGAPADVAVTKAALERLAPGTGLQVDLRLDLPVRQGFGMSAAGTLAACLAATHLLDLDPDEALTATHAAEVTSGTGLGDAIGSWFGGGEVRIKPGCPPRGWAMRIEPPAGTAFLFCVLGAGIATPSIIRDAAWKQRTRQLADPVVDRIVAAGRPLAWDLLLRESAAFSQSLGLMPPVMQSAGGALPSGVQWGQCMLGNTLWATGKPEALAQARTHLAKVGKVLSCGVDLAGARQVRNP